MTARLRSMTDDELGRALAGLDLAWPPDPDLAPRVIAATRGERHPKILRLPLSRTKRILLIAAATVLLLAGAAVAARFLVDLGAVVVERTPGPVAQPSPTASSVFGTPLTIAEAAEVLGDDVPLPFDLGRPDRIWADEVFTEAGQVVRVTVTWRARPGLPAIEGSEHGAVLMRFEGDVDQAWKELYETTGRIEPARVQGVEAIWTTGRHTVQLLTSEGIVHVGVDGNILLWRHGRYTMRLETSLRKVEAVRIAETVGTP
ncbi:MAG: hypothetical protein ACRDG8_06350 [Actinomycetota bacterium]